MQTGKLQPLPKPPNQWQRQSPSNSVLVLRITCYIFNHSWSEIDSRHQRCSRGHNLRGQRLEKNPKPRTDFSRTDPLEAKDKNQRWSREHKAQGQEGHKKISRPRPRRDPLEVKVEDQGQVDRPRGKGYSPPPWQLYWMEHFFPRVQVETCAQMHTRVKLLEGMQM